MPYTPQDWANSPATSTPLTAARLAHIETQYAEARADAVIDVAADVANPASGIGAALSATFVSVEGAPADGDAIVWDDVAGQWVPAAVEGGADGEGVPTGGTTAQVLAKASGTDFDTEWVDQSGGASFPLTFYPTPAGIWVNTPGLASPGVQTTTTKDRMWLAPIYPRADAVIDRISINAYAGAVDGVVRVGLYGADANGHPTGAPIAESALSVTSAGKKQATVSATATAPIAFLAGVLQGPNSGLDVWWFKSASVPSQTPDDGYLFNLDEGGYLIDNAWYLDGVTGALPDLTSETLTRTIRVLRIAARLA